MSSLLKHSSLHLLRRFSVRNVCSVRLRCLRTASLIPNNEDLVSVIGVQDSFPAQQSFLLSSCRSSRHRPFNQLATLNSTLVCQQQRFYRSGKIRRRGDQSDDQPEPQKPTPQLMDFPWVIWPSIWHTVRNWILSNLLIYRYLDQEFSLSSFRTGAIQALVHVSQDLSKGNFNALEGLITKPSLEEIKANFSRLNLKQRLDLAVQEDDIFLTFIHQIGIIFTNEGSTSERIFVEVTMCYHIFRGFQDYLKSKSEGTAAGGIKGVYDNHDRISIANYRFIREFTKGVDDDWTITLANHFKPGEVIGGR